MRAPGPAASPAAEMPKGARMRDLWRLWLLPLLLVLSVGLSPAAHRSPPDLPAWLAAGLCGEGTPDAVAPPCPFCLLQAAFHLPASDGPLLTLPAPRPVLAVFPAAAAPRAPAPRHDRPPSRGPPVPVPDLIA